MMKEGFEVYQQYTKQGFEAKQDKKVELFYGLNRFVYNVYFRNGLFRDYLEWRIGQSVALVTVLLC